MGGREPRGQANVGGTDEPRGEIVILLFLTSPDPRNAPNMVNERLNSREILPDDCEPFAKGCGCIQDPAKQSGVARRWSADFEVRCRSRAQKISGPRQVVKQGGVQAGTIMGGISAAAEELHSTVIVAMARESCGQTRCFLFHQVKRARISLVRAITPSP